LQAFLTTFSNEDICERPTFLYLAMHSHSRRRTTGTVTRSGSSGHLPPRNHFPFMVMLPSGRPRLASRHITDTLQPRWCSCSWHFLRPFEALFLLWFNFWEATDPTRK
jgi:hypothetical protein